MFIHLHLITELSLMPLKCFSFNIFLWLISMHQVICVSLVIFFFIRDEKTRKPLTENIVLLLCIQIFLLQCSPECLCPVLVYSPWLLIKSDSGMVILETDMSLLICLALSLDSVHVYAWRNFSVILEAEDNVQPVVIASCTCAQYLLLEDQGVGRPPLCNSAATQR